MERKQTCCSVSRLVAVAFASVTMLVGCVLFSRALPPPTYVVEAAQPLDPVAYRRVLLLPPVGRDVEPNHLALLQESLRLALAKHGYLVLAPAPDDSAASGGGLTEDPAVLAALAEKARADIVLAVRVLDYRPYPPPRIVLVVRAYTGGLADVLWELRGTWDLNEARVADRYEAFRRRELSHGFVRLRHRAVIEAPREFLRYVAHELAAALASEPAATVADQSPKSATILPGPAAHENGAGMAPAP